jgi:hypothetical protein
MFVYIIIHGMYQTTIFRIHYIFVNYFCFLDGNPEVFVSINLQFFLKPSKTQVSMNYTEFQIYGEHIEVILIVLADQLHQTCSNYMENTSLR